MASPCTKIRAFPERLNGFDDSRDVAMIKVAVAGALGQMGRASCAAIAAADDLDLVGGFARAGGGASPHGMRLYDDITDLYDEQKPDVVVDFTYYPTTVDVAREAVERRISPVIGATGWTDEDRTSFESMCDEYAVGAAIVPNFAIGAVLMMRFAEQAAKFFPTVEIVEMHHDGKRDAPSGTSKLTAERIATARGGGEVPIHSVRLRGLVAHQAVMFGGDGEVLTIRHDSLSRTSFMAGVLLAVRSVRAQSKLVVGLDAFLGDPET
jgi:4-hydroxy-tetrahydrodipicolinate reductase